MKAADRAKLRHLQNELLRLSAVKKWADDHGEWKPLWEGGPSVGQLTAMIYPKWESKIRGLLNELKGK